MRRGCLVSLFSLLLALCFAVAPLSAATEKILHSFSAYPRGSQPGSTLVADPSGNFYGTTRIGGTSQLGTVFKLTHNQDGSWAETVLYNFNGGNDGANPIDGVSFDGAGNLFGTTSEGGAYAKGTIFQLAPVVGGQWQESVLYSFTGASDGQNPQSGLLVDAAGNLFGTTGSAFELKRSSSQWTFQVIRAFTDTDGSGPLGRLVMDQAGNIYGTTQSGGGGGSWGTVYELSPKGDGSWAETVLYDFNNGTDGSIPLAGVILDAAGNLYGTASAGGNPYCPGGCGTAFELVTNGNGSWTYILLHEFTGVQDGGFPWSGLALDSAGNLYGSTFFGGNAQPCTTPSFGCGAVFELKRSSHGGWSERILSSFASTAKGYVYLTATPIFDQAGNLYGTTPFGGNANAGMFFQLVPSSSGKWTKNIPFTFNSSDGSNPYPGIVMDAAGNIYGATVEGGTYANGAVYELSPNTNGTWTRTILHSFKGGTDGASPNQVMLDADGNLYGTASIGGNPSCNVGRGCGVAFRLSPPSSGQWSYSVIYTFAGPDGNQPSGGLISDSSGNLYGTTTYGGISLGGGYGTVFELIPGSGGSWTESVLHSFYATSPDGTYPNARLTMDSSGNLYGTTTSSSPVGFGTVFRLTPGADNQWTETILHTFTGSPGDGSYPGASVILDADGNLYGSTPDGGDSCGAGCGILFRLKPTQNGPWTETILRNFHLNGADGYSPWAGLTFDNGGNLYVTTGYGGSSACSGRGCGALFKLTPAGEGHWTETLIHVFKGSPHDGSSLSAVTFDAAGNMFATAGGGAAGEGAVVEIIP